MLKTTFRGTLYGAVVVLLTAFGCGGNAPTPPTSPAGKIVSIQIVPSTDALKVGESAFYTVDPTIVGIAPPGPPPFWSSTNLSIATVESSGEVTALAPGETSIQVLFRGLKATRFLQVLP